MTDKEYAYAKENEDVLNNLLEVAHTNFEDTYYDNIPDIITRLLKENEKVVDTAQLDIFKDVDTNDEEGSDNPTPCVVI